MCPHQGEPPLGGWRRRVKKPARERDHSHSKKVRAQRRLKEAEKRGVPTNIGDPLNTFGGKKGGKK